MIWPAATQAENLGFFGEIHGAEYPQFDWLESDFKHTSSGQLQGEVVEGDQQVERVHHHQPQPHTGQTWVGESDNTALFYKYDPSHYIGKGELQGDTLDRVLSSVYEQPSTDKIEGNINHQQQ